MKLRARPFPRCFNDWATSLFLSAAIPLTYWFELWIVTPAVSANALYNTFNFVLGTFLLFNVVGNMMALMLCNTSIIGEKIIRRAKTNSSLWKFCAICETVTPPRSWHCSTCRVCILKRDHHCMFTGKFKLKNEENKKKINFQFKFCLCFQVAALAITIIVISWDFCSIYSLERLIQQF